MKHLRESISMPFEVLRVSAPEAYEEKRRHLRRSLPHLLETRIGLLAELFGVGQPENRTLRDNHRGRVVAFRQPVPNRFDGDAGLVYELYQDVAIPANHTATLQTNHRIVYDSLGINSTLDRIFEISIRDLGNAVLAGLYSQSVTMNGASRTDLGWDAKAFDVSAFAGSTVRVHFREFIPETYTGPANIELDQISLIAVPVPEPASIAMLLCGSLALVARRERR